MTKAHHDVRIDRPIQEVFDFLSDGANNPRWQSLLVSTVPPTEPVAVGSTFRQRARHPLGFTVSADYRVIGFERPRRLVVETISGGPLRPTVTYDLSSAGEHSTDLSCTIEHHPTGLTNLARPVLFVLHPLFSWEASWVERVRKVLEPEIESAA